MISERESDNYRHLPLYLPGIFERRLEAYPKLHKDVVEQHQRLNILSKGQDFIKQVHPVMIQTRKMIASPGGESREQSPESCYNRLSKMSRFEQKFEGCQETSE